MKKLLCLLLVFLVLPVVSFSDEFIYKFTAYGDGISDIPLLDADAFSLDLYMKKDLTAYIVLTVWKNGAAFTSARQARVKSFSSDPDNMYFTFPDDTYYTGHYDGDKTWRLWLNLPGGSVCLTMADEFNPYADLEKGA